MDLSGGAGWCTTFCPHCTTKLGSVYGQKLPQNAKNQTYEAISASGGSKMVVQGWYKAGNITEKWSSISVNFALNVVTTRFLKPFLLFVRFAAFL